MNLISTNKNIVANELVEMGFKGKLLRDLLSVIKNYDDFQNFQFFIINNDGKFKSKVQLVQQYIIYLQKTSSYSSKCEFILDYMKKEDKKEVYEKLFMSHVDTVTLNKVEKLLMNGLTLEDLYDKVIEYRSKYNTFTVVCKIENLYNTLDQKIKKSS
jgi:hypothetical protein